MIDAITNWIASASDRERPFRKAVHIILHAIASAQPLQHEMVMKGGILLGIAYDTGRFTKDIDFSTKRKYQKFDKVVFLECLK